LSVKTLLYGADADAEQLYQYLASAAESGWDFSTRWLGRSSTSLSSIKTSRIIPVDLNVFLYWGETLLAKFHHIVGGSLNLVL
jgi:alpha,alpha-trehalase